MTGYRSSTFEAKTLSIGFRPLPQTTREANFVSLTRPSSGFGKMSLDCIGPENVAAWFDAASKDKLGAANRAFEILRSMRRPRSVSTMGGAFLLSNCGEAYDQESESPDSGRRPRR